MADGTENPVIDAGQFLGDDGTFSDNYLEQMYHEDDPMRTDQTLKNTKSVRSMASQLVNSEKRLGQLSGGREFAVLPNEQSTDEERNEYATKTGRPDAPEGYKLSELQLPDGVQKDDVFATHMGKVMFDAGVPHKMGIAVINGYLSHIKASMDAAATQDKIDDQTANKELRGLAGAAYDEMMKDAVAAIDAFGRPINATEADAMIKDLPYDVFATQLLAKAGAVIREHGGLHDAPGRTDGALTPADARAKADELRRDPYFITSRPEGKPANKTYHEELVQKVNTLTELATDKGGG